METTHLILVRHGESLHNRGDVTADVDSGLTELGWRQSQLAADWLARSYKADVVLSSTLTRARQTAAMIGRRLQLPVQVQPGLEEAAQSYWNELPPAHQNGPLSLWDEAWQPTEENAPVYSAFRAQLRLGLEQILAAHAGKTIIIITHGGAVGTLLRSLFGGHYLPVFTQNTGITHIAWKDGHWQLLIHNIHEHLAPISIPRNASTTPDARLPFPWARTDAIQVAQEHYRRVALASCNYDGDDEGDIEALIALAPVSPGAVVLDVGCGTGVVGLTLSRVAGCVIGVDITPAMLERAERSRLKSNISNMELLWAEASDLPVDDRSADLLASRNLWPHLADPSAYIREAARVLKSDGRLLMDELIGSDDPVKRATQEAVEVRRNPSFIHLSTQEEIERLLENGGFRLEKALPYEVGREVDAWLGCADENTRGEVRNMLETGADTDAAGLRVRRNRDGGLSFTQRRLRLSARLEERSAL